ncbi:MAG: LysR family transcriptional regulator [Bacillota bacterium]
MNLSYLKLFNTLAEELSFSKAASLLYISQPAVSMQIKKLEEDLGLKLFEREGKHISLTDNGKILYQYTRKIFELVDEVDTILCNKSDCIKGIVEIGASNAPGTYLLPGVIGEFKEIYTDVVVNLHISNTYEIERMVLDNKIDFAIIGGEEVVDGDVQVERLFEDELIFVCSPMNKLAALDYAERDDLVDMKFVVHEKNSRLYNLIDKILHELQLPSNIVMTLGHIDAIKQAVELDLGISAIPASTVKVELKHGLLRQVKLRDKSWHYPYNLVFSNNRHHSTASKKLLEMVRERMKRTTL